MLGSPQPSRRATCQPITATAGKRCPGIGCRLPEPDTLHKKYYTLVEYHDMWKSEKQTGKGIQLNTSYTTKAILDQSPLMTFSLSKNAGFLQLVQHNLRPFKDLFLQEFKNNSTPLIHKLDPHCTVKAASSSTDS